MYVEEAHNLTGKKADLDETGPRIAKEGAKAQIALVYATREPSWVHANILANIENWFVTPLNNDDECAPGCLVGRLRARPGLEQP